MPANTQPTRIFDLLEVISSGPPGRVMFSSVNKGEWRDYSVSDYRNYADLTSYALLNFGISKSEPVLSITHNRAEFNFVDMGILQAGAVHVPLYPGVDVVKLSSVLDETKARIAFISNKSVLRKIRQLPKCELQLIVSFDPAEGAVSFEEFLQQGNENRQELDVIKASVKPDDPASIIYLSGSNTPLKGVVLSHANHVFNLLYYCTSHHFEGCTHSISFLPLAHSFERTVNYSFQYLGIKVSYSEGIASLAGILKQKKPDVMLAVPLVLERIVENTKNEIQKAKGIIGWLAHIALRLAAKEKAGSAKKSFSLKNSLFRLIFKGLRNFLGGNIKVLLCGGAALRPEVLNILWAAGINTYEGYGLTEAGPLVSYNLKNAFKRQSVGRLMPGVEVRIASDNEVLVKSGGLMKGYFKIEETPIDSEGWLHTGDFGEMDAEGFLTLTSTKKEIFKLSSGLYSDPRPIETQLSLFLHIDKIWVFGHNKSFLTAIVIPDYNSVNYKANPVPAVKRTNSRPADSEIIRMEIEKEISSYNSSCQKYDQIVKFEITDDVWTAENGFLNNDGALNRQTLYSQYRSVIEKMYS
jgi:long-chain acyl-CoA synthetase